MDCVHNDMALQNVVRGGSVFPDSHWTMYTLGDTLQEVKGDAAHRKSMTVATPDMTVDSALSLMSTNKLDALPVVATKKKALKKCSALSPNLMMIISSADITDFILRGGNIGTATLSDMFDAVGGRSPELMQDFVDMTTPHSLRDIVAESFMWSFSPLRRGAASHGSRVYTVDEHGAVADVLTEIDVINMVNVYPNLLGAWASRSVGDLWARRGIVTVKDTDTALQAFATMRRAMVTGAPVVDSFGILQADLNVSDITGVRAATVSQLLQMTVLDFLRNKNDQELKHANLAPTTCPPTATVREAIGKKSVARHHRVYVAEKRQEGISAGMIPVGVVSLCDVLRSTVGI